MAEAIEQRRSGFSSPNTLTDPRSQIGSDDGRAAFIALGQQVEEQLAAGALKRNETQLIHD